MLLQTLYPLLLLKVSGVLVCSCLWRCACWMGFDAWISADHSLTYTVPGCIPCLPAYLLQLLPTSTSANKPSWPLLATPTAPQAASTTPTTTTPQLLQAQPAAAVVAQVARPATARAARAAAQLRLSTAAAPALQSAPSVAMTPGVTRLHQLPRRWVFVAGVCMHALLRGQLPLLLRAWCQWPIWQSACELSAWGAAPLSACECLSRPWGN